MTEEAKEFDEELVDYEEEEDVTEEPKVTVDGKDTKK
jgi:hypothetical protein